MAKQKNLKELSHTLVNVGTIGHVDHGKTTLNKPAITSVFAKQGLAAIKDYASMRCTRRKRTRYYD